MADPYYSSGTDLKAKNELGASEGPDVPAWALAHLDLTSLTTALDVGSGWGRFARPLLERTEVLQYLVCADISPGMLGTCRLTLADVQRTAFFVACDVRLLPFAPGSFDVVMANHMLYELAEPTAAAAELARVLRRRGTLVATTYSDQVRVHLMEFHQAALAELGVHPPPEPPASFSLENGERVLREAFDHVDVDTLEDVRRLVPDRLTEIYLRSGRYLSALRDDALPPSTREKLAHTFYAQACSAEAREGQLLGRTVWAVFLARRPRSSRRARTRPAATWTSQTGTPPGGRPKL